MTTPQESDECNGTELGLQWQWNANPSPHWAIPSGKKGFLRLYSVPLPDSFRNFYLDVPNTLLQKFPAPVFVATTKIWFGPRHEFEKAGLIILGKDYSYLGIKDSANHTIISQTLCSNADEGTPETELPNQFETDSTLLYLRVTVSDNALCEFSYSLDGVAFSVVGKPFKAREGGWIGAKMGLFMVSERKSNDAGNIDVDWFRIEQKGTRDK